MYESELSAWMALVLRLRERDGLWKNWDRNSHLLAALNVHFIQSDLALHSVHCLSFWVSFDIRPQVLQLQSTAPCIPGPAYSSKGTLFAYLWS